jgi:hypothetical protein
MSERRSLASPCLVLIISTTFPALRHNYGRSSLLEFCKSPDYLDKPDRSQPPGTGNGILESRISKPRVQGVVPPRLRPLLRGSVCHRMGKHALCAAHTSMKKRVAVMKCKVRQAQQWSCNRCTGHHAKWTRQAVNVFPSSYPMIRSAILVTD